MRIVDYNPQTNTAATVFESGPRFNIFLLLNMAKFMRIFWFKNTDVYF